MKAIGAEAALRQSNSAESVVKIRRERNLKSDLKRSTAAVRKAKNISDETLQQLSADILTVNLARHVQEAGSQCLCLRVCTWGPGCVDRGDCVLASVRLCVCV